MAFYVFCDDNCKYEGMTRAQILEAIQHAIENGSVADPVDAVISRLKETNAGGSVQMWTGTEAEFNAIDPAPQYTLGVVRIGADGVLYLCTDDNTLDNVQPHAERHAMHGEDAITPAMIGALSTEGGEMGDFLTVRGLKLTEGIDYGDELPEAGNAGRIFFKKV